MTKLKLIVVFLLVAFVSAFGKITVKTIDFLDQVGVQINAAGPLLVQVDSLRNRIILANTLTSSMSVIDGETHQVTNIPLFGRAFQHLKSEAMTLNQKDGSVYLIGKNCFFMVFPENKNSKTVETQSQFESIAVDENTGNVFLAGRESKQLGFYHAKEKKLKLVDWLETNEQLINLNATPPPPIRKVVADNKLNQIIAVDGLTAKLFIFDSRNGKLLRSRPLDLLKGGRWHFAGYNQQNHCLYLVIERDDRKVVRAAKIDVQGQDAILPLHEFTEGVGINYHPNRDEIYIPYDNHPSVHVVDFKNSGEVTEIKLPAFGNDASAIDFENDILYIASWAHGEIDVVDLKTRSLIKRVPGLGILPHMFNMAFNPNNGLLYVPKGATAVNGSFGAALCAFDPKNENFEKVNTGWAPIDLVEMKNRNSFLVFNSEDTFAEVSYDDRVEYHRLPYDYPVTSVHNQQGDVYLSYGPHQSYWPNVYIWDAKNGILTIDKDDLSFYDRRIPRQAHKLALDKNGVLYFTQNNWGTEEQFLGRLPDPVRLFEIGKRIPLQDKVSREITQRILKYDLKKNWLYLVRIGETDTDPSILQVVVLDSQKVMQRIEVGNTATDLVFDDRSVYVSNFGSNTVSVISKTDFTQQQVSTEKQPLKICRCADQVFVLNHSGNSIQNVTENKTYPLPVTGLPDFLCCWGNELFVVSHTPNTFYAYLFDPKAENFQLIHSYDYPFGNTRFDTRNVSFYMNGQYGDAIFSLNQARTDQSGRLWLTDFLSGKLLIFDEK